VLKITSFHYGVKTWSAPELKLQAREKLLCLQHKEKINKVRFAWVEWKEHEENFLWKFSQKILQDQDRKLLSRIHETLQGLRFPWFFLRKNLWRFFLKSAYNDDIISDYASWNITSCFAEKKPLQRLEFRWKRFCSATQQLDAVGKFKQKKHLEKLRRSRVCCLNAYIEFQVTRELFSSSPDCVDRPRQIFLLRFDARIFR
jgi:hypothetical protein